MLRACLVLTRRCDKRRDSKRGIRPLAYLQLACSQSNWGENSQIWGLFCDDLSLSISNVVVGPALVVLIMIARRPLARTIKKL